jgi:nucleoid-associated protein EbfC
LAGTAKERILKLPGNLQQMMQQAQKMQERLREEIAQIKVSATVGGGVVAVEMDGQKNLLDVKIDPEVAGDVESLRDLILSAVREATRKVDEEVGKKVNANVSGLGLPPGLF